MKIHKACEDLSYNVYFEYNMGCNYLYLEIHCPVNVSNGNLSQSCGTLVGDTCDTYSCDDGFKKNENVSILSCMGSGLWDHGLDTMCVGLYSIYLYLSSEM